MQLKSFHPPLIPFTWYKLPVPGTAFLQASACPGPVHWQYYCTCGTTAVRGSEAASAASICCDLHVIRPTITPHNRTKLIKMRRAERRERCTQKRKHERRGPGHNLGPPFLVLTEPIYCTAPDETQDLPLEHDPKFTYLIW